MELIARLRLKCHYHTHCTNALGRCSEKLLPRRCWFGCVTTSDEPDAMQIKSKPFVCSERRMCRIRRKSNMKNLHCRIRKMPMTSFAITPYGQRCRRHVVGQQVVSDVSIVRCCWSICGLCSESNNTNLLLRLVIAVLGTSILLHIPNMLHGRMYLVDIDRVSDVTAPSL